VGVSKDEDSGDENGKKSANAGSASGTGSSSSFSSANKTHPPIVAAGTVSYAVMLTEANSDVPGPILAQIVSGPLAGARAIGEFKVTQDPYLIMRFTLATLKGKEYKINALALDPDTTLGGMATEVDERYMTRVLLPAAAGFLQGFGSALGQGSSSVVTNGTSTIIQQSGQGLQQGAFQGLAQMGQTLGQFLENQANQTQPLVRVAAGTPFGLFFIESVCSYFACQGPSQDENDNPRPAAAGNTTSGNFAGYNTTMFGNAGQTPMAGMPNNGTNAAYSNANVPYPNTAMPYNGRALTNPNSSIAPYNGSSYANTVPNAYGIGTPLVNP
jgi:intracellular multiplication protein IcmE